jgi:hypothetical protein
MGHPWAKDTPFERRELVTQERRCPACERVMKICDHRHHRIFTLEGPVHLLNKLVHCCDKGCPKHSTTVSPEAEMQFTLPYWAIGWDVFAWIGQRRFARHWSVPQIHQELRDTYHIDLSQDAIEDYVQRYEVMLAARQQDPVRMAQEYREVESVILSIDGLQPEKGHETLYVVRELRRKRVWFAQSLISSAEEEIRALIVQAKEWAQRLGKPVVGWISDKQEAFVKTIAAEFPGVPHRYCQNHFLRDAAQPMLEADSHAKVRMRRKVRGLRQIEREVLAQQRQAASPKPPRRGAPKVPETSAPSKQEVALPDSAGQVVLDYCTAVRGILNSDQGGPLSPASLRMAEGLNEVRESLQRSLDAKKGGPRTSRSTGSPGASTEDLPRSPKTKRRFADRFRTSARSRRPSIRKTVPQKIAARRSTRSSADS